MSSLSSGPFNYNRFSGIEEMRMREKLYFMEKAKEKKAKKLDPVGKEDEDIDNDGDVDKSDKYLHNRRKAIGKAMGKDDKKEMKESSCGPDCDCDTCKESRAKKKKMMKEGSDIQYPKGPKQKFTKDKSDPKVAAGRKAAKDMGLLKNEEMKEGYGAPGHNPGSGEKSVARAKALMDKQGRKGAPGLNAMSAAKKEHEARRGVKKEEITVDDVTAYLMEGGFCNNEVSAEVMINNMSDKWLETILDELRG